MFCETFYGIFVETSREEVFETLLIYWNRSSNCSAKHSMKFSLKRPLKESLKRALLDTILRYIMVLWFYDTLVPDLSNPPVGIFFPAISPTLLRVYFQYMLGRMVNAFTGETYNLKMQMVAESWRYYSILHRRRCNLINRLI